MKDTEGAGAGAHAGASEGAGAELTARLVAEVDWTKVVDPAAVPKPDGQYGPDLLERLWSPDLRTADNAHATLHFTCSGDGGSVRPAAPEVLPFLVEAVRDPAVKVRPQILETLAVLARAGNEARAAAPGPGPGGWWRTAPAAWPAAWERAVDALLPLLADEVEGDEDVRAGVAAVLARATHRADDLVDRLLARFDDEPDPTAAEQLVLGRGRSGPSRGGAARGRRRVAAAADDRRGEGRGAGHGRRHRGVARLDGTARARCPAGRDRRAAPCPPAAVMW
ncbi:hypothetical protein RB201_35145 [Streptomyces sp. S1A(2023)]